VRVPIRYLAGFFDGEGSIGIYAGGGRHVHLRTQLTQALSGDTLALLELLREAFGGNVAWMQRRSERDRQAINWQLNGRRAAVFLNEIGRFLLFKRAQAAVAAAWELSRPAPARDLTGRMVGFPVGPYDYSIARLVKCLKYESWQAASVRQPEFAECMRGLAGRMSDLLPALQWETADRRIEVLTDTSAGCPLTPMAYALSPPYVAGFFEAEGSIGVYGDGERGHALQVQLVQLESTTSMAVLGALRAVFGGAVVRNSSRGRRRACLGWLARGGRAARFLEFVRPHLRLKALQADIALTWESRRPRLARDRRGRVLPRPSWPIDDAVREVLRLLKKRDGETTIAEYPELFDAMQPMFDDRSRTWIG